MNRRTFLSTDATATAVLSTPIAVRAAEASRRIPIGFLGATYSHGPDKIKLATKLAEMQAVVALAREKKLLLQTGFMRRYNPGFIAIFDAVRQGWLGDEGTAAATDRGNDLEAGASQVTMEELPQCDDHET